MVDSKVARSAANLAALKVALTVETKADHWAAHLAETMAVPRVG